MAEIIEFPLGEPEPERPRFGWCGRCGVQMLVPNEGAWPETCPRGCTPVIVLSWNPKATDGWGFSYT